MFKSIKHLFDTIILYIRDLSIIKKLLVSYVFILTIPIVFSGIYYFNSFSNSVKKDALTLSEQDVTKIKNNIERNIYICQKAAVSIQTNDEFLDFFSSVAIQEPIEVINFNNKVMKTIRNISNAYFEINPIRIYISKDILDFKIDGIYDEKLVQNTEWWKAVTKNDGQFLWRMNCNLENTITNNLSENQKGVSLYYELKNVNDAHLGVVEISMSEDKFFSNMSIREAGGNPSSFICVLKGDELVTSNKIELLEKDDLNFIKESLINNTAYEKGTFTVQLSKDELLVTYDHIGGSFNTYIYGVTYTKSLMKNLIRARNFIYIFVLGSIALLAIIIYLVTSILLEKMKVIVATMRRVEEGNMFVDIPLKGKDEVGELATHFQKMLNKINELIFTLVRKEAATKDAEIRALQSQINTHFMYNVLEAIKAQAEVNYDYTTADSIIALGRMMRYSMNWSRKYVTLKDEILNVRDYISLMNLRYNNKVELNVDYPDELNKTEMLKMTLQPVVENSVNHGFKPRRGEGSINITAKQTGEVIIIEVLDNGVGISEDNTKGLNEKMKNCGQTNGDVGGESGIGLGNINERIKLFFGDAYGIVINSLQGEYTKITVSIPLYQKKRGDSYGENITR